MTTGTMPSNAQPPLVETPDLEDFIQQQVQRTQSCVRAVDILGALMTLGAIVLGYLLLMAVVDHWLIFGGLGAWGRSLGGLGLLGLVVGYVARTLWPYCRHRINPIYAADALERAQPTLQNSLVNFLLLKRQHTGVSEAVFRGVQQQAAAGLTDVAAESAVDRRRLTRVGATLIGILAVAALYWILFSKSPLKSAARVLAPWADLPAVTRVQIENVRPGDAETPLGQPVAVLAEIRGLGDDEAVTLHFSTLDAEVEGQSARMYRDSEAAAHSAQLPPDTAGPQRDLVYRIEAGDAVAGPFHLRVVPVPTIQIEKIEYLYPAYTELAARTVERLGDIKAIEGTRVVIHATASQPIDSAAVELDGLRGQTQPMLSRGELAARFELPLRFVQVGQRREPEFTSYRLRLTSRRGDRNREPVTFQIEVTPDLPPQVDIVAPAEREIKLPADKDLQVEVRARDADYGLSDLRLVGTRDAETLLDEPLLKDEPPPWSKTYRRPYRLVPAQFRLKPGDVVSLRAVASDNKSPEPNRAETSEVRVVIVEPENSPQANQPPKDGSKKSDPENKNKSPSGKKPGENQPGGADESGGSDQPDGSDGGKGGEQKKDGQSSEGKGAGDKSSGKSGSEGGDDTKNQPGEGAGGGPSNKAGEAGKPSSDAKPEGGSDSQQGDSASEGANANSGSGEKGTKSQGGRPKSGDHSGEGTSEPIDNDGDAIAEVLKQMRKEGKAPADDKGEQKSGQPQPTEKQNSKEQSAEKGMGENGKDEKGTAEEGKGESGMSEQAKGEKAKGEKSEKSEKSEKGMSEAAKGETAKGEKGKGEAAKGENGMGEKGMSETANSEKGKGETGKSETGMGEKEPGEKSAAEQSEGQQEKAKPPSGSPDGHDQKAGEQPDGAKAGEKQPSGAQGGEKPKGSEASQAQDKPTTPNATPGGDKPPSDAKSTDEHSANQPQQRSSNTQSDGGSDRAGKGQQGSGQQQSGAGQGSAGNNQASDEGANRSKESGPGEKSSQAGNQEQSDRATGKAGNAAGNASQGKGDDHQQPKPESKEKDQPPSKTPGANDMAPNHGSEPGQGQSVQGGSPSGQPGASPGQTGELKGPAAAPPPGPGDDNAPGADEANVDYARRATDLAISYLQDQLDKGQVDPNLQKRFGWTEEEFRSLVRRLEANRDRATRLGAGPTDQKAYDDWLRSLGLRPPGGAIKTGQAEKQRLPGATDNEQITVPSVLREQHEAFRRGVIEESRSGP